MLAIARAEATEAAAAIEIAVACGDSSTVGRDRVVSTARRLTAMLTKRIRERISMRVIGSGRALEPMTAPDLAPDP